MIRPGKAWLILRARDEVPAGGYAEAPSSLAAAMRRLASNPAQRSGVGARSAELIASYAQDSWAEAFEEPVESILSSSRIGSSS